MASDGDTITYTFSGAKETEDISDIDEITIDSMHGADGGLGSSTATRASGGYIENSTADVSNYDTLEIWVGDEPYQGGTSTWGKSDGGKGGGSDAGKGGGSTEIWTNNTSDFIAATDAGGGAGYDAQFEDSEGGGGGARGGVGGTADKDGNDAEGTGFGGDGSDGLGAGEDGGQELGIASLTASGTLTTGGSNNGNGEIKLSFKKGLTAPGDVLSTIRGANVELNWSNSSDTGEIEVQRSTDGFQTVETVDTGLPGNTPSFVDRSPQRNQQVEYRVVRKDGGSTAQSNSVQIDLPTFTEVSNPGLGNGNKPRFSNVGVPGSGGSVKLYKANGVEPVFPDDYTLVQESSNGIDEFQDDAASNNSYVSYAFTSVDSNGNESNPDIRQTFVPPEDAAVLRDNDSQ